MTGTTSRRRTTHITDLHHALNLQATPPTSWRGSSIPSSSWELDYPRALSSRAASSAEPPSSSGKGTSNSRGLSSPQELASSSRGRSSPVRSISRSSGATGGEGDRRRRQSSAADDIPEFDRNKVSLNIPGSLFGPSVSLLIRTTKIIGDVIQNSAVRYQTFLRLFRPLFRGPFEIKGLDPPTTTTTTTTTTTARPQDNEVRRRRHL